MHVHHWTPGQIRELTLDEFRFALEQTRLWQEREAAQVRAQMKR